MIVSGSISTFATGIWQNFYLWITILAGKKKENQDVQDVQDQYLEEKETEGDVSPVHFLAVVFKSLLYEFPVDVKLSLTRVVLFQFP